MVSYYAGLDADTKALKIGISEKNKWKDQFTAANFQDRNWFKKTNNFKGYLDYYPYNLGVEQFYTYGGNPAIPGNRVAPLT